MMETQECYLLQIKLIDNGEWHDCRNDKGTILVFINDFDAYNYTNTDQFKKLSGYAIETRLVKQQIIKCNIGVGLQ